MGSRLTLKLSRKTALEMWMKVTKIKEPSDKELEDFLEDYCLTEDNYNLRVNEVYEDDYNVHHSFNEKFNKSETEPFTFAQLKRKLGWHVFCELTGTNFWSDSEGQEIKPDEIYYISQENIKKFNL